MSFHTTTQNDTATTPTFKERTACFTGGRPKSLYPTYAYAASRELDYTGMIGNIYEVIENLYNNHGITRFISGGAQGFDQLAFRAVAFLKNKHPEVQNIVYVPFDNQDNRWMDNGRFGKKEYQDMLAKADEVHVCTENFDAISAPFYAVSKALFYRNECMCNDSCICIGQYPDDSWQLPTTKGGTAGCLRYARDLGMQLIIKDFRP